MNAGEFKKMLKDIPNHFEIALEGFETKGKPHRVSGHAFAFKVGNDQVGHCITEMSDERYKRSNVLVLLVGNSLEAPKDECST